MKISSIVIGMALLLGACGNDYAKEGEKIADEMCKCTDSACADKVKEKWVALGKKAREEFKKKDDVPKDLMEKMDKIEKRYRDCRNKAQEGDKKSE